MLLVDSETAIAQSHQTQPWAHLLQRDNWSKPNGSNDTDCHLMVQIMEVGFSC